MKKLPEVIPESERNKFSPSYIPAWHRTNGRCWYCGRQTYENIYLLNRYKEWMFDAEFVVDHLIPRIKGGSDAPENLVPCCRLCNSRKGAKSLEDFRAHISRLFYHIPRFSDEQINYLLENGIELPPLPHFVFWFEKEGLS